jgi:hypothetical protein
MYRKGSKSKWRQLGTWDLGATTFEMMIAEESLLLEV